MDTVFFWLSKLVWMVISPDSLLVLMMIGSFALLAWNKQKAGKRLLGMTVTLCVLIAVLPLDQWLIAPLERQFPANPALPAQVDGIIVLGGALNASATVVWEQVQLNESGERLTAFAELALRYPQAKLVFSGGSGSPLQQGYREGDYIPGFMASLGLPAERIIIERNSRNTWENVLRSKELVKPQPGEQWVLITSASHMPRSVSIFNAVDWPVIAYPVDHRSTPGTGLNMDVAFAENLDSLRDGAREWVGLIVYRITGRAK